MNVAVLLEDAAAVAGVGVAAVSMGMVYLTGNHLYDAVGSILIGGLLGAVALTLIQKNRVLLTGGYVSRKKKQKIVDMLSKDPVVKGVHDVRAEMMSNKSMRFKAEIEFDGKAMANKYFNQLFGNDAHLEQTWNDWKNVEDVKKFLVDFGDGVVQSTGKEIDRLEIEIRKQHVEAEHIDLESHWATPVNKKDEIERF
eukprot:TRINITY_DN13308_c0_g1_i2.p1 TRINITY_DN13308_c0_g1~~TRINITY_DN13308_c0_g1_i2.p1  ORF type:complete len:197 (-),score=42.95 TRINITY_DN13308_c0_g1_i2:35-625(-)